MIAVIPAKAGIQKREQFFVTLHNTSWIRDCIAPLYRRCLPAPPETSPVPHRRGSLGVIGVIGVIASDAVRGSIPGQAPRREALPPPVNT